MQIYKFLFDFGPIIYIIFKNTLQSLFIFYYITTFAAGLASRVIRFTPTELSLCHGGKKMRVK